MARVPFEQLPDDARLWVFPASRVLTPTEERALLQRIDAYLDGWKAHGAPLRAGRDVRYHRFLLIAADESAAGASGCSIDALLRELREAERGMEVTLTDHAPVDYLSGEEVRRIDRTEFARLADAGDVDLDTAVFDNTVTTVGAVRGGRWQTPARDAWHAKVFFRGKVGAKGR